MIGRAAGSSGIGDPVWHVAALPAEAGMRFGNSDGVEARRSSLEAIRIGREPIFAPLGWSASTWPTPPSAVRASMVAMI